jgi:hypothetical protein
MLLMALSGAAVLALVCWAALRESETTTADAVISQAGPGAHHDGMRHASQVPASPSVTAAPATAPAELDDATVADADTDEALAAAAALWTVLIQDRG